MCAIAANKVTTFDHVVVEMPAAAATCEAVVAKDCSAQAAFVVTTAADASMMTTVKVVVPGCVIEVMSRTSGPVVAVNGIPRVVPAAAPVTIAAG